MEIPLQIAFRKLEKSDWAEQQIRDRVDKLEKIYGDILGVNATVDQRAQNTEGNIPPVVRLDISIPGGAPIVVAYEPERLQRKFRSPDLGNAIRHAFDLAERQLRQLKSQRAGRPDEWDHDAENQFLAQIAEIHHDQDHGFLLTKEGGTLYFHRNSVMDGSFDEMKRGDAVHYVEEIGDTGPLAKKVRTQKRATTE